MNNLISAVILATAIILILYWSSKLAAWTSRNQSRRQIWDSAGGADSGYVGSSDDHGGHHAGYHGSGFDGSHSGGFDGGGSHGGGDGGGGGGDGGGGGSGH